MASTGQYHDLAGAGDRGTYREAERFVSSRPIVESTPSVAAIEAGFTTACLLRSQCGVVLRSPGNRRGGTPPAWQDELIAAYQDAAGESDRGMLNEALQRVALFLAFNTIRNSTVMDLDDPDMRNLWQALNERICAAVEDLHALDLGQPAT